MTLLLLLSGAGEQDAVLSSIVWVTPARSFVTVSRARGFATVTPGRAFATVTEDRGLTTITAGRSFITVTKDRAR